MVIDVLGKKEISNTCYGNNYYVIETLRTVKLDVSLAQDLSASLSYIHFYIDI